MNAKHGNFDCASSSGELLGAVRPVVGPPAIGPTPTWTQRMVCQRAMHNGRDMRQI